MSTFSYDFDLEAGGIVKIILELILILYIIYEFPVTELKEVPFISVVSANAFRCVKLIALPN